jgi:hypothetical protein
LSQRSTRAVKLKLTTEERQIRLADQLKMIWQRMMIPQALGDNGITTTAGIGATLPLACQE